MLATLIELQRLKNLDRTGWPLRGLPPGTESVAAHSFGVALTAMLLADAMIARGVAIDVERVLRMAILHDAAETRVGDLPRTATDYFGAAVRKRAERSAFDDIVRDCGPMTAAAYSKIHEDYEERESLEARIVKAADVIDLLVEVLSFERAGVRGLEEFWESSWESDFGLTGVPHEIISELVAALVVERKSLGLDGPRNELS